MVETFLYINNQDYSDNITGMYVLNTYDNYILELSMNNVIIYKPINDLDVKIIINGETLYSTSENINTDVYKLEIIQSQSNTKVRLSKDKTQSA